MVNRIFEIKNNKIDFDPAILLIPEFNRIWKRARAKERALKEFAYIYYTVDYNSIYNGYPVEVRKKEIAIDFMGNKNYKPDAVIQKALDKYEELQDSYTIRMIKSVKRGMESTIKIIDEIGKDIEKLLKDKSKKIKDEKGKNIDKNRNIDRALLLSKKIQEYAEKLPLTVKALRELENEIKKEEEKSERIIGGGVKGDFENPEDVDEQI